MPLDEAQELFTLFFAIYFGLIIDRSHQMYRPWDTYNAWKRKPHNIKRLLAAWIFLFITPVIHFSILFILLGSLDILFDISLRGISNVVLISLGSFFDFGYFRIYEAFLHKYPKSFFTDEEILQMEYFDETHQDFQAHFIPGILYVLVSTLFVLVAIYY